MYTGRRGPDQRGRRADAGGLSAVPGGTVPGHRRYARCHTGPAVPLFNTREGHRRAWTLASERAGAGNLPPITHAAFGCTPGGVGTRTCFCPTGEGLGRVATLLGSLVRGQGEIAQSEPARRVVYDIDGGFMATRRTIEFEPVGDGVTRVVWVEEATATNPSMRYVLLGASRFPTFDGVRSAAGDLANAD